MELVVFSDDWGRHPSSCQHLVRRLLPRYRVTWIDTIGTRRPQLDLYTVGRGLGKIASWARGSTSPPEASVGPAPEVCRPIMWPSFRSNLGRRLNRRLLGRALDRTAGDLPRVGVTTLPIVADLVGRPGIERWIYYCVDDLSQWPGLDARTLATMERELVRRADRILAVSEVLVERMASFGRRAELLTHGVDLEHWRMAARADVELPAREAATVLFWGLIDRRLDLEWLDRLAALPELRKIVLAGPTNDPDPKLGQIEKLELLGPIAYDRLPALARTASVLIMPYADLPATRAMQPLKLKEYLATGRPVVTSGLPATTVWSDACDVAATTDEFVRAVAHRLDGALPASQQTARERLASEGWDRKAVRFERAILAEG